LKRFGRRPAVLLRGYGARSVGSALSEETLVLREALGPDVPVEADPSRVEGARRVLEAHPQVDVFVLDDGFQHRQVARAVDLVLVDATNPFGGEHLLPRGLLREPVGSLRRADAIVVTRCDQAGIQRTLECDRRIQDSSGRMPLAHAAHQWTALRDASDKDLPLTALRRLRIAGVCGIANPASFERSLRERAGTLIWIQVLDDHQVYDADMLRGLVSQSLEEGADAIVTTEKDWVKWRGLLSDTEKAVVPVYRPVLQLRFLDGDQALDALLQGLFLQR